MAKTGNGSTIEFTITGKETSTKLVEYMRRQDIDLPVRFEAATILIERMMQDRQWATDI